MSLMHVRDTGIMQIGHSHHFLTFCEHIYHAPRVDILREVTKEFPRIFSLFFLGLFNKILNFVVSKESESIFNILCGKYLKSKFLNLPTT